MYTIWADCGTLLIDGSAAASFSPIVEKYEIIRLDFSWSVKARVLSSLWRGPILSCVNGFIALLSKFR